MGRCVTLPFGSAGSNGLNLVPGAGIAAQFENVNRSLAVANTAGNVLLFLPLGGLLGPVLGWRSGRAIASAALLSVTIEAMQLLIRRAADIDDVLNGRTVMSAG